jgi:hypothetical protein
MSSVILERRDKAICCSVSAQSTRTLLIMCLSNHRFAKLTPDLYENSLFYEQKVFLRNSYCATREQKRKRFHFALLERDITLSLG